MLCLDTKVIICALCAVTFHPMRLHVTLCHCFVVVDVVCRSTVLSGPVVTWCRVLCCYDIVRHLPPPVLYTSHLDCPSAIFHVCLTGNNISDVTYHAC